MHLSPIRLAIVAAVALAACTPAVPPSQSPKALKDLAANTGFAYAADELCTGIVANEPVIERASEDVVVEMVNAGYTSVQIDSMLAGLARDEAWMFPYVVALQRKYDLDLDDDAGFCRAMDAELRANTPIGLFLRRDV